MNCRYHGPGGGLVLFGVVWALQQTRRNSVSLGTNPGTTIAVGEVIFVAWVDKATSWWDFDKSAFIVRNEVKSRLVLERFLWRIELEVTQGEIDWFGGHRRKLVDLIREENSSKKFVVVRWWSQIWNDSITVGLIQEQRNFHVVLEPRRYFQTA